MKVPEIVYEGRIDDYFYEENSDDEFSIEGFFRISSSESREFITDIMGEFQDLIDENEKYSLDFSGSGDQMGWAQGFCPCNHLDECKDVKEAELKVNQLTNKFRDFLISKGIACEQVNIKVEKC